MYMYIYIYIYIYTYVQREREREREDKMIGGLAARPDLLAPDPGQLQQIRPQVWHGLAIIL